MIDWAVIQGDCLDVMRTLGDCSVDAVVTDPPWMDYRTGRYDASAWHAPIEKVDPSTYSAELFRVLRDRAALVLWCRWDVFQDHADALSAVGFRVLNCIVWAKPNHTAGDLSGNLGNRHEVAVFAAKGKWRRHDSRDVNLWDEPHLFSRSARHHPTQKPVGLMARSVRLAAPPGGLVLDPFNGSGSTGCAAVHEGRQYLGIEREPEYCEIARARIAHWADKATTERDPAQPGLFEEAS